MGVQVAWHLVEVELPAEDLEHLLTGRLAHHPAAHDHLHQGREPPWRRLGQPAHVVTDLLEVDPVVEHDRPHAKLAVDPSVDDVDPSDPIDQHVGRGVVTDDDHQHPEVVDGWSQARLQVPQDARAENDVGGGHLDAVVEAQLALGGLSEDLDQHDELDRAGSRKHRVRLVQHLFAGGEVLRRQAELA